jgi:hypothetical protein
MLGAPRRGPADSSPNGRFGLLTTTQYSFEEQSSTAVIQLLDLETGNITDSTFNASEINEIMWLPGTATGVIYITGTNEDVLGGVTIWIGDVSNASAR